MHAPWTSIWNGMRKCYPKNSTENLIKNSERLITKPVHYVRESHQSYFRIGFCPKLHWNFVTFILHASCSVQLQTGRPGFDFRLRKSTFPLATVSRPALRSTQPPTQWVPGILSPGVKLSRGVTLSTHPPSSAEVKNEYELDPLSPLVPARW
jgi:hypothetical protein